MSVQSASVPHADRAGFFMVLIAAIAWSTSGFFIRLIPLDLWTMLGWRSLFGALSIFAFAYWHNGGRLHLRKLMTPHGVLVVVCSGVGMICFVASTKLTSVANVAVLYGTLPFMAAALAWIWLRERPSRRTLIASLAALVGVVIMARESIGGGHLVGDAIAIAMTLLTAILAVSARRQRDTPLLEGVAMGGVLAMVAGMLFGTPAMASAVDIAWLALFGAFTVGFGMALFTVGARRVPSAQAALLGATEMPFAPFWVWLAFGEVPPTATFIGGALITTALLWHFAGELRQPPQV